VQTVKVQFTLGGAYMAMELLLPACMHWLHIICNICTGCT
jgi:hypothetical protein